jgi:hypothetical protein
VRITDKVEINATADRIWEYVGSPQMWPLFHVKAGECRPVGPGAETIGSVYDIEFRLDSRTAMTRCEIVDIRVGRLISVKSVLPKSERRGGRELSGRITFEVEDLGRQSRVREELEFTSAGIPILLRPLVWLISRFGTPAGETTLMRLKRIVEGDAVPPGPSARAMVP